MHQSKRTTFPLRSAIASYWAERGTFPKLDLHTPGCFACAWGTDPEGKNLDEQWNRIRLERCHLIAAAEGGDCDVSNLVLLCHRCHTEAPVVGRTNRFMVEWINRRQEYLDWAVRRVTEELEGIRPSLAREFKALGDRTGCIPMMAKFMRMFKALGDRTGCIPMMAKFMRIGAHPTSVDQWATIAAMFAAIADLKELLPEGTK